MSIELTFRVLPTYLQLDCTGPFAQDSALETFTEAFALATEHARDTILIDVRGVRPPEPTLMQRYDQAVHIAEIHLRQIPRVRLAG